MVKSWLRLPGKQLGQIIGLLIVLGYVDINVVTFRASQMTFALRGPLFSRLTSGVPRLLRAPGHTQTDTFTGSSFVKIEALLAYLLLTGQALIYSYTVVGSGIVLNVRSPHFRFKSLERIVEERKDNPLDRVVLTLLNLAIGVGLIQNTFGISGTVYRSSAYRLGFSVTSAAVAPRAKRQGPAATGLASIPNGGPAYKRFNQIVGVLLVLRQLAVYSVSVSKGGRLVLSVSGEILELKAFPKMLSAWFGNGPAPMSITSSNDPPTPEPGP